MARTFTMKVVGHRLCPYVQRAVITMVECGIEFERTDIDLNEKPDWLADMSPGGLVPVVEVASGRWLFESGVISEFVDDEAAGGLLPAEPFERALHKAWIGYIDDLLRIVAQIIYLDADQVAVGASLSKQMVGLEMIIDRFPPRPYLAGLKLGLIDIVFATLVRYSKVLSLIDETAASVPKGVADWWKTVSNRASIQAAVPTDYDRELVRFIAAKDSYAGRWLSVTR